MAGRFATRDLDCWLILDLEWHGRGKRLHTAGMPVDSARFTSQEPHSAKTMPKPHANPPWRAGGTKADRETPMLGVYKVSRANVKSGGRVCGRGTDRPCALPWRPSQGDKQISDVLT